jgi:hypothetical protein
VLHRSSSSTTSVRSPSPRREGGRLGLEEYLDVHLSVNF